VPAAPTKSFSFELGVLANTGQVDLYNGRETGVLVVLIANNQNAGFTG